VLRLSEYYESQSATQNPEPVFVEVEGGSTEGEDSRHNDDVSNQESEEVKLRLDTSLKTVTK
jgi:hypothetical protein